MSCRCRYFCVAAVLVSVLGCGTPKSVYNPFKLPREQFYPNLNSIALIPVKVTASTDPFGEYAEIFDSLLLKELGKSGIELVEVPKLESDSLQDVYMDELGGLFDPKTGRRIEENVKKWRQKFLGELRDRYDVDAVLFSSISLVMANFYRDHARWDGTSQGVGKDTFAKALLGVSHSGTMPAISLIVELRNIGDTLLYRNAGGIQVLGKIGAFGGPDMVDRSEILEDEKRNLRAVQIAIYPLMDKIVPTVSGRSKKRPQNSTLSD